jgi:hypothetical protein
MIPALLESVCVCVCVCVCVRARARDQRASESERLRRDGGCQHGALQQRAAGAAPLGEAVGVCVLMHVGVGQANTRLQEQQRVSTVREVRWRCRPRAPECCEAKL